MAFKMKAGKAGPMKKNFPDLNKDGTVTQADILMGRGVIDSPNKKTTYTLMKDGKKVKVSKAEYEKALGGKAGSKLQN